MGKIGTGELILILAIALIVVGPSKLPELGKAVGKTLNEFKKFSKDIKEDLSLEETVKKIEKSDEPKDKKAEEKEEIELKENKEDDDLKA